MISESPDLFLADFGVPVVFGAYTGKGILDMPSEIIAGGMVLTTDYQLTIKTAAFPGIKRGDAITVNSVSYTVREARLQDDGVFTNVFLSQQ